MRLFLMLLTNLLLLACAGASRADDERIELRWAMPQAKGDPHIKSAEGPSGEPAIQVRASDETGCRSTVMVTWDPPVSSHQYVVRGKVKYEGVVGDGYLELLNNFGDKGEFFTRTLAAAGPMGKITGTSDWRDFELPFTSEPGMRPKQLTLRVVLTGVGTVTVTQPKLSNVKTSSPWWTESQSGWLGGVLGTLLGILGGFIGYTSSKPRLTPLLPRVAWAGLAFSGALLIAGGISLIVGQPWHVFYPLLLGGGIAGLALRARLPAIRQRAQDEELRRMSGFDA